MSVVETLPNLSSVLWCGPRSSGISHSGHSVALLPGDRASQLARDEPAGSHWRYTSMMVVSCLIKKMVVLQGTTIILGDHMSSIDKVCRLKMWCHHFMGFTSP